MKVKLDVNKWAITENLEVWLLTEGLLNCIGLIIYNQNNQKLGLIHIGGQQTLLNGPQLDNFKNYLQGVGQNITHAIMIFTNEIPNEYLKQRVKGLVNERTINQNSLYEFEGTGVRCKLEQPPVLEQPNSDPDFNYNLYNQSLQGFFTNDVHYLNQLQDPNFLLSHGEL